MDLREIEVFSEGNNQLAILYIQVPILLHLFGGEIKRSSPIFLPRGEAKRMSPDNLGFKKGFQKHLFSFEKNSFNFNINA